MAEAVRPEDYILWRAIVLIALPLVALQLLALALCREWVKLDLRSRQCEPVSIRWRPFYWWPTWGPCFRVLYKDPDRNLHHVLCGVPMWRKPIVWRNK